MKIHTIDLKFRGIAGTIASYLIPHTQGCLLIETGPGSTLANLLAGLQDLGFAPGEVTDVFVTHIHLDHAGASGWFARQGANIHVHKNGKRHLNDPSRLMASAARIYGDQMEELWGEMLPVPEGKLFALDDLQETEVGGISLQALDTPGHATHHMAYMVGETLFTGDIGGVRLAGPPFIRLPMPPPEFHLAHWRASFERIRRLPVSKIAATHFGIYPDVESHWGMLEEELDAVAAWIDEIMPASPSVEDLEAAVSAWFAERQPGNGVKLGAAHEAANPAWMSAGGIKRYWEKFRQFGP